MDIGKYLINDVCYTKSEVLASVDLQKELMIQLKKQHYRDRSRARAKLYRESHRAEVNEYNRLYQKTKYATDSVYKAKIQQYHKDYQQNHKVSSIDIKIKGRPSIFKLDLDLGLIAAN